MAVLKIYDPFTGRLIRRLEIVGPADYAPKQVELEIVPSDKALRKIDWKYPNASRERKLPLAQSQTLRDANPFIRSRRRPKGSKVRTKG